MPVADGLILRPMQQSECAAVAAFVGRLAVDLGLDAVPGLDARALEENTFGASALIDVTVAEANGALCGACLALMTYSTWRAARGLYVVDLFVDGASRGNRIGERLLRAAAARGAARGARFIKLEVDHTNAAAARFYGRLGFARKDADRLFVLEEEDVARWLGRASLAGED